MGVETKPEAGIYLHVAAETEVGIRIMEIWEREEQFQAFLRNIMIPASAAVGVDRKTDVTVEPLFNFFAPRLEEIPSLKTRAGAVVATLDVDGLTATEFRAILDHMGVETDPEPGLFVHLTTPFKTGFRIVELWDAQANFEAFRQRRLNPASQALGIEHPTEVSFYPIHNVFAPRLGELPALVPTLAGGPGH